MKTDKEKIEMTTNGKFGLAPKNIAQEVLEEVAQEYDFVMEDYVSHVYKDEQAQNSAVATIMIAADKRAKGVYGLAEKYQKALAKEGLDTKMMDTWRFVVESRVKSLGYEIKDADSAKINGYISHVIGTETEPKAIEQKILEYIFNLLPIPPEKSEDEKKRFGLNRA